MISCGSNTNKSEGKLKSGSVPTTKKLEIKPDSSLPKVIKVIKDSLISTEELVTYKNYSMKIITVSGNDSVEGSETHLFKPYVISQKFIFMKNDKIINRSRVPVKMVYQRVERGSKKKMVSCVFSFPKIVKLQNGRIIYYITGYGGCNGGCPSCNAVFSLNGKFIVSGYTETRISTNRKFNYYLDEIDKGVVLNPD